MRLKNEAKRQGGCGLMLKKRRQIMTKEATEESRKLQKASGKDEAELF
jgi:hypothetical protein